jgi:hypothetical protein
MARVRRGSSSYKRGNARNYINEQAQRRLDETVKPFNKQVENSLFVNAVEVDYYQIQSRIGKACTCEKIEVRPEHKTMHNNGPDDTNVEPVIPTVDEDSSTGLSIQLQDDNLFGDSPGEKLFGETVFDVSGNDMFKDDDIPQEVYEDATRKEGDVSFSETSMFGTNANCGICYKTGYQPGYHAYGKQRHLLTTWDIERIGGYTMVSASTPNRMRRQGPIADYSFVEFQIHVPKYFVSCTYSIRNNTQILPAEKILVEGRPLTKDTLVNYAGKMLTFRINALEFSHVVLEFDLGLPKVRANLGAESQALDYSKLDAISNFPVVLPPSIHEVNNGDILVAKDRRMVLKVMDKERKITADKRQLEWMVQTRIVQKTEPLRDIAKGLKIL